MLKLFPRNGSLQIDLMEKIKVLLIDDDEDDFIITKDIFSQIPSVKKYELSWANSFEKGINAVLKQQHDIYLVDYRLGKNTGIDLLNEAILSGIKEPIIILTGKGDYDIDQQALNFGAADYLVKDQINAQLLDRTLRYALKQADAIRALKESEFKFRVIFEKTKEPILISDFNGKIYEMNKAGLNFFGFHPNDLNSVTDRQLFKNSEDRDSFIQQLETKGAVSNFECEMISSSGQTYFCTLSSFLQIDPQNIMSIYHTIIHDLTPRKYKENNSINQSKLSVSAHIAKAFAEEIRDPLSTINFVIEELNTDKNLAYNETVQTNLDIIKTNCDNINQLIKQVIVSTENKPLSFEKVNIKELIEYALSEVNDLVLGQRISVDKDILNADLEILADEYQLKKALQNILVNAIENMHDFPKAIHITTIKDSGFYSILIEDNGPGLSKNYNDNILEPFFSTKKPGNGLALTEAQKIVMNHNGVIEIKPQDLGNLVVIKLPIAY